VTRLATVAVAVAIYALAATGCEDPSNRLDGSLSSQYDLSFDRVQARQFEGSRQLLIEYIRGDGGGEEKPIMTTIRPVPNGPGQFRFEDGNVGVDSSLLPGQPDLPELTSATVDLDEFTPNEEGSTVRGSLGAMFTNEGTGDAFSLEGAFETELDVVNF